MLFDQPIIGRIVAPDLTAAVRRYSDSELAVIVRHGLRPDGRSVMVNAAHASDAPESAVREMNIIGIDKDTIRPWVEKYYPA